MILYGNEDTNSAFKVLLSQCPIKILKNCVKIGQKVYYGDLGAFFTYPLADSDDNLVGVVGSSSVEAIGAVTKQASASAETMAAAAQEMHSQTEELRQVVDQFKLRN